MKKLILLYDENTTTPEDINKANELINTEISSPTGNKSFLTSTDIKYIEYIKNNLPPNISLAWEDKENDVLELI